MAMTSLRNSSDYIAPVNGYTSNNESNDAVISDNTVSNLLIACMALEGVLIIIAGWILACMIVYGTKTKKWMRKPDEPFLNNKTLFIVCLAAAALTIPRFAWSIAVIQIPRFKGSDSFCEVIMDITGVTYSMAMCPAYLFLWLRQRALYARPTIRELTGRCANIFSWCLMAGLTVGSLVMVVVIQAPESYLAVTQGCLFRQDVGFNVKFYILAGLLVGSQFFLLCLFIYPMIKTRKARERADSGLPYLTAEEIKLNNPQQPCRVNLLACCSAGKRGTKRRPGVLEKTMRRTIASTIVAVISDVTTMAVANFVLPPSLPIGVAVTLYDVSIIINIFCILATFASHRKILLVFCVPPKKVSDGYGHSDTDHSEKRSRRVNNVRLPLEVTDVEL